MIISQQKLDPKIYLYIFLIDFKNFIGFSLALWENAQTDTLFEGTKFVIFKGKRPVWMSPISEKIIFGF